MECTSYDFTNEFCKSYNSCFENIASHTETFHLYVKNAQGFPKSEDKIITLPELDALYGLSILKDRRCISMSTCKSIFLVSPMAMKRNVAKKYGCNCTIKYQYEIKVPYNISHMQFHSSLIAYLL